MSADLTLAEGLALSEHIDRRDGVVRPFRRVRLSWLDGPLPAWSWSTWAAPCQRCQLDTHARDRHGLPMHVACAEAALADRLEAAR